MIQGAQAIGDLETAIRRDGRRGVIEQVAYTWFNRFTALRFMDANGYTQIRTVSPAEGATRPEILSEAMAGTLPDGAPAAIAALLENRAPSHDPQAEAYRLLLVHACNQWHGPMPFLFEELNDFTELLMPEDLLSQTSILARLREVMTEDACADVEIIGWLYQFYMSEKKDQVFAGLKKNQKITAENIPAATQLFTPHWIVRYLVENSLGRLWLLNRPGSRLAERMDYYIAPEESETDFLKITRPEEIRICDPAAGSGHMLTYAFDLLYAIYEEEGYDATAIPALILTHNLTGVEIDDRAGALAAFALAMKAAARLGRRRFLRMEAKPDICVLQNVAFTPAEMQDVAAVVGKDLFTDELRETLGQFEQAKNFGSLIVPKLRDPAETLRVVAARDFGSDLLLKDVQDRIVAVLRMAEALSPKYHVVVANPPYAGAKGLNPALKSWLEDKYPTSKADLMTCFMDRATILTRKSSFWGMINLPSWLFLSSFYELRKYLLVRSTISSLLQLGRGIFGADFGAVAFVVRTSRSTDGEKGYFRRLFDKRVEVRNPDAIEARFLDKSDGVYWADPIDFTNIPGAPIAYWVSETVRGLFNAEPSLGDKLEAKQGVATADNGRFLRQWWEPESTNCMLDASSQDHVEVSGSKWVSYNKGGEFRRWYGNQEFVVNWENSGEELYAFRPKSVIRNPDYYFRRSVSWSDVTSGGSAFRLYPKGFIFDSTGHSAFCTSAYSGNLVLCFANTKIAQDLFNIINPTIHLHVGYFKSLPALKIPDEDARRIATKCVAFACSDWNAYETSWDFTTLPLLSEGHRCETLADSYATLRGHWQSMTDEMQALEEENNRIFIDAYGLQDELTPEVPIEEITLTCNPAYRYGVKVSEEDRETRLRADTMAEFLSYAVGCMFGRYSLDAPGLILANQGERLEDYLARLAERGIPEPRFMPDADNVIPVLDGDWFADDITERFRLFLRVTFGEAHFRENLRYVEEALGKDIRKYFTKDFYADHVKRYKKRPIYWMFSSPKGTFNALIYMHRYRADTVSVLLND
ncbi:BREX-1 system adenine-specific DNA-methyltransferase PglX [Pararhodobacter marinus]|uniref:BREX-1 system adenine-specific DNA-methyltransferase PglX n=1 Tax=Pararhodobacter marinus TaxID=2184063 RepID=UPI0035187DFD